MASQEDTQEGDAKAQLLAEAFQKEGLDAGYWLPKMSQILGIKCREALQHLEYEDYLKLECAARHPWEKKALKKLLNITDDKTASKEVQKEHLEKTKQRQEVAKQALKDLTEMLNSHSHSQDVLREQTETLWRAMEIPKEFWPSPKEPLAEMLESIHKQLEQQQEMSAGRRENIPDTEVLRRASGGLALQGIYRTSRAGDVLATREQLLRVPEGFQLAGPEQGSLLERREFSSSAAESTFTKSIPEVAKQALKDLTEMLNSHSHSQDALREQTETLWRAMEIPKEFWPSPKEPLAEMLQSIHKQLEQQQEMSAGRRENIPDTEVLRRASGGLALQGIYRTSRAGDVLATREQLLRVPEGFQLAGPKQGSQLDSREFSSSAEESNFTMSMEQLGFSMRFSAKFFTLWGINLKDSVDYSRSSQSEATHQSYSEQSYFCTTKFQYIPLASCYFQRHQLHLSDAALRELQHMEQIMGFTQNEDNPIILKMCESFFSRFGSHINQGPLHFGGIFWWKASTKGFRAEQREKVKRQTSEALNSFVRKSYGDVLESAAGALDVSTSSSKASVLRRAAESSHTAIQFYVANTGGPADTTSLPQWKTGLVSDNTTWCVIDRGFELIPVWDVILCNHSGDFKSVGQMSRALRDAYKALTNESVGEIFGEELDSAVQEARDFMETVKAWEVTVDERKLHMLMEVKDDLSAKTKNHRVWTNVCLSDRALQDFLVNTVRSCQESPPESTSSIKVMLRSLLDPHIYFVKDFPEASFIMKWIFQNEHPLPRSPKISELEELIKTLQEMKEHIYAVTYAPGSSASAPVNLKEQDADRAEASLLLMGLTVTPGSQKLSPEQKRERLIFMEDHMEGLWSPQIKNLLQKHSAGTDWIRLEWDLHSLISGCLHEKWDEQKILRNLEDTFPTHEPPSLSKCKSDSSQPKANEVSANKEFIQLLNHLGLASHYPRKMGMGDFQTICKISLQDSQPNKDKEIPLYLLQNLLNVDYQVKYLTCSTENPDLELMPDTREQNDQYSKSFENVLDNLMG
ncbi:PREDICTED: interferon-induced very large GTPase 1-like, partial [Ficedula albicollis]|uniref:interferon-induced very large GTPase 1-like n=1 Tax=Ficedula albicollis TaxID=59894 RepID=UPI0007AD79E1